MPALQVSCGCRERFCCLDVRSTGKVESMGGLPDRITACLFDIGVVRPIPQLCGGHPSPPSCLGRLKAETIYPGPPGEHGRGQRLERR
jgi:hypothetical protein